MALQALSLGHQIDVWKPRSGIVHSTFERAVNLLVAGDMWTVLGAAGADSSFGIRLAAGSIGRDVKAAERVDVRAGSVAVGRLKLDCRTASRWAPSRWAPPAAGMATRLAAVERTARPRAWMDSADIADDVTSALRRSDADLTHAVRRAVGRGPGLTPAGDDVLAGILALFTSGAAGAAGEQATSRLARALAPVLFTTSDISRHLLQQATRGLLGRPLHDLGRALMNGASHDDLADAAARAVDVGCTSGADACMGLISACRFMFLETERAAA